MKKPKQQKAESRKGRHTGNPDGVSGTSDAASWARVAFFVCIALAAGILAAWAGALTSDQPTSPGLHVSYLLGFLVAILSAGIVQKSRREYLTELAELDQSIESVRTDAIGGERGQLLLREMMEDVGVGWYRMSADGRLEAANLALAVMLGFDSVDALRSVCKGNAFAGSTDRTSALSALQTLGEIRNHSASWPTAHGRRARLLESARTMRDDTGRLRHIEGVAVLASGIEGPAPRAEAPKVVEPVAAEPEIPVPDPEPARLDEHPGSVGESPATRPGQAVPLRALLEDTLENTVRQAERRGLEIGFRLADESTPEVQVDGELLRQALQQLMESALRHTVDGGVVLHATLSRTADDYYAGHFEFRCTTGSDQVGDLARVFERGASGSNGSAPVDGRDASATRGRELVERLGGSVQLKPGNGSSFSLHASVPLDPLHDAESATRDELEGINVLLVDDHEISSAFVAHQLDASGSTVLVADRPAEAARIVEQEGGIDVIVASLSSARGAAEFVGHLKKIDAALRPPLVLVVPSDLRSRDGRPGSRLGKPVRRNDLIRAILASLPEEKPEERPAATVVAPVVQTAPAAQKADGPKVTPGQESSAMSVLVAEDDPVNGRLMLYLLEGMGYDVVLVRTGDQAVTAFKDRDFDAAIMDVRMPGLSGPDAARRILRNTAARGATPILVGMTASTASWDRDACLSAGMRAVLVKPLSTDAIREALETPAPMAGDRARADRPSIPSPRSKRSAPAEQGDEEPVPVSSDDAMKEVRGYLESHHAEEPARSAELLATFLRTASDLVDHIADAHVDEDTNELQSTAEALRTSCGQIGFSRLSSLCQALESVASDEAGTGDPAPWVAAIQDTFDAVRPTLDAEQAEFAHLAALHSTL